jgi:WD40 repeat protein
MKTAVATLILLCLAAGARAQNAATRLATFKTDGKLTSVAFSPDGKLLAASYGEKTTVRILDARTGELRAKLEGKDDPQGVQQGSIFVSRVTLAPAESTFSPDGRLLAVIAYRANEVRVWDVQTGARSLTLRGLTNVHDVTFSPDGSVLAIAAGDQGLRLVDVAKGTLLTTRWDVRSIKSVNGVWFHKDGKTVALFTSNTDSPKRSLYLVDLETGRVQARAGDRRGRDNYIAYVSEGFEEFVTVAEDGELSLWETATGRLKRGLKPVGSGKGFPPIDFGPGARTFATLDREGLVKVWDFERGQLLATLPLTEKAETFAYRSGPPSLILTASKQGVRLWDGKTFEPRGELPGARLPLAFSRDGRTAVTAGEGETAVLWDVSKL